MPNVGLLGLWVVNLDGTGLQRVLAGPASAPSVNYACTAPRLGIALAGNSITISWPTSAFGLVLEAAESVIKPINWIAVPDVPVAIGGQNVVTNNRPPGKKFFRLRQP